jgi:hypothetical protein
MSPNGVRRRLAASELMGVAEPSTTRYENDYELLQRGLAVDCKSSPEGSNGEEAGGNGLWRAGHTPAEFMAGNKFSGTRPSG